MGLQPPTLYGGLPTSIPQRQDAPREKNEEEKNMTNTTCLDVAREYIRLKAELAEMTARCNEMRQEIMTYMTRAGKTRVASEEIGGDHGGAGASVAQSAGYQGPARRSS